jgi:hypothetical protein
VQLASAASATASRDDDCLDGHGGFEGEEHSDDDGRGFSVVWSRTSDALSGYKTQMMWHGLLQSMDAAGTEEARIERILLPPRMHSASHDISNEMAFFAVPDYNRVTLKLDMKRWLQPGFCILQNGKRVFFCNCCESGMVAHSQAEMQRCHSVSEDGADISSCECDHAMLIMDAVDGQDDTIVQMIMDAHRTNSELRVVGVCVGVLVYTRD